MVPISNSSVVFSRTLTGNGRNVAVAKAQNPSVVAADEPLTYAHIGATGFYSDRGANEAPTGPDTTDAYGHSSRANRFREIFELQAASLASQQAAAPQSNASFLATTTNGAAMQGNLRDPAVAKKEMKWAISMVGNKVQIAVNPNAP